MEYEQIKQLMEDMGNSKLSSIDIEFPDGIKIKMEKKEEKQVVISNKNETDYQREIDRIEDNKKELVQEIQEKKVKIEEEKKGNIVTSPMVGTFYMKSSPNSDPYVEVGTIVKKGTVLCIIEAMKLMNEIESEYDGRIEEIYVKDGETVEYGKPLFRIV